MPEIAQHFGERVEAAGIVIDQKDACPRLAFQQVRPVTLRQ
jgi:hypothetical protein